jgi:hypothetical protein
VVNHIRAVFIPAGCIGELQPLDISVNDVFKKELKLCFSYWYPNEVSTALSNGVGVEGVSVDLRISIIKPRHANWLINVVSKLKEQRKQFKEDLKSLLLQLSVDTLQTLHYICNVVC